MATQPGPRPSARLGAYAYGQGGVVSVGWAWFPARAGSGSLMLLRSASAPGAGMVTVIATRLADVVSSGLAQASKWLLEPQSAGGRGKTCTHTSR